MRGTIGRIGAWTALALLVMAGGVPARAEDVPLHMVPKPVLDAVRARFNGARIVRAEKDRAPGTFVYEITIKHQGQTIDAILAPDGAMRLIKTEIAATDLPQPVAQALADAHPQATFQAAEAVITVQGRHERLAYYEVDLVTAQRRIVEVRVSQDGRILASER